MDTKDLQLYQEEQRQKLLDLQKHITTLHEKLDGVVRVAVENPTEKVEVTGELTVNTQEEVTIKNISAFSDDVAVLSERIAKAIEDSRPEKVTSLEVTNLKDAVSITNIKVFGDHVDKLVKAVENIQPIVNVTKQEITFPTSASKPVAVRLSDGKGFYNALVAAFSGGSGGAGLATSAKQDDIITAIGGISSGGGSPLSSYVYIQKDTADATHKYYAYKKVNGDYLIKQIARSTNLALFYANTVGGYNADWTGRAGLTYAQLEDVL